MSQKEAEEIAFEWQYNGIYTFYNMEVDKAHLTAFLKPDRRKDHYYTVLQNEEMIGFFSFDPKSSLTVEIGLGMRPDLTGQGLGKSFVSAGIDFVRLHYQPKFITLRVAAFNQRAIKVYERIGFTEIDRYMQYTNGSHFDFAKMVYHCK